MLQKQKKSENHILTVPHLVDNLDKKKKRIRLLFRKHLKGIKIEINVYC